MRRTLDLRPGEARLVASSGAILFGLIAAHTMLETARDALFLGKLPVSRLPLVYALLALVSVLAAKTNARFINAFGRRNALILTLLGSAFGTVVFYLLEPTETVVFALYVWSALLGSVLVVQFWMLAGNTYTVSQGKRLFGLLAAGGVLGAVTGAAFSALALGFLDVRDLLVGAATVFLATALGLTSQEVDEPLDGDVPTEGPRGAMSNVGGLVAEYPYLLRLVALVALSTAAVLTTDYLFKAVAVASRPPEELGTFFARFYALLNSIALLVQVFVASTLVRRTGVVGSFLVLPGLLVVGGGASMLLGGSLPALATKGADGALRHSLHRIAQELLWMPLPEHVRALAKGFVDTVVVRGTQAVVAALLLLLATLDLDRPPYLAGLVLALSVAWITFGVRLRSPYLDLFRSALAQRGSRARLELDLRSVEVVVESLSSRDPQQAIAAMDLLASSNRSRLIPALILYHESEEVLLRALEVIADPDRRDWISLAERLLTHKEERVRVAALQALAGAGQESAVRGRLLDISPWVRAQAAFWLAQGRARGAPGEEGPIQLILDMPGASGRRARAGLLDAIGKSGDDRWADLVLTLAESDEPEVALAAVTAMSTIRDERFIPVLVRRLGVREGRSRVREAIVALGPPAFQALEAALDAPDVEARVRVHLPATIARFGDRQAADVLLRTLEDTKDGRLRYKVLRAIELLTAKTGLRLDRGILERRMLHDLREHFRSAALHRTFELALAEEGAMGRESGELLVGLLRDKRDQALDRVFSLLQASYPQEDLRAVRSAGRSSNRRRRAQAQEFLEALTLGAREPELRELLRVAVDDLPDDERLRRAQPLLEMPLARGLDSTVQELLRDPDLAVSSLAAYHVLESGRPSLRRVVIEETRERPLGDALQDILRRALIGEEATGLA